MRIKTSLLDRFLACMKPASITLRPPCAGVFFSPIEVEDALTAHPLIHECAATEIKIKQDVCVIAAFYTSADVIDEAQLTAFCAEILAGYKRPRLFIRVETLPRGANNKLLRRILRQDWETSHGQA